VTPHEIAHLFNALHADGALMRISVTTICDDNLPPSFSDKTLNKIRTTLHP
jgi:hypothetical protein